MLSPWEKYASHHLKRLGRNMEHPVSNFHPQLRPKPQKGPVSLGDRARSLRLKA
jgi:hypothetical protein